MPRSADALVKPEMLVWARDSAHLGIARAAEKVGVSVERLEAWEQGEAHPTVKQLRKLAHVYRQSFAAFYLPSPPDDRIPEITDYRRLAGGIITALSYELAMEIRTTLDRRAIALEILEEAGIEPPSFDLRVSLEEDTESVGNAIRNLLGIELREQISWRDNRMAFNAWREAAEEAGILVFQARGIEVNEMRGFSISQHPLPAVAVNRKDAYAGRIFSLLHEVTHLALNVNGVCDFATALRPPEEQRVEVFCNYVAGAAIVPSSALLGHSEVRAVAGPQDWSEETLRRLARTFGTSREMILRRLLILDLTTNSFYERKRGEYAEELKRLPRPKGFAPPATDALSAAGKPFVRMVLRALNANQITTSDVADYLGVRLKHLPRITETVGM